MIRSHNHNHTQIDKMVIDAAKQHMRVVCGDVLDQLKGNNYEVHSHDNTKTINDILCRL